MKSRRGLSSVVGMVFSIIAIVSTVGYVTYSLNVLDKFDQSVLARNQMSIDAGKEKFDIYNVDITNTGKFNITISNTGSLPINITRMWVQNTTSNVVDWTYSYNCHNCAVSPGSILKNIGVSMPVGANPLYTYNLKLATSRGNTMQFSMGSPGVKPLYLQLRIVPSTILPFNNASLLLTATNNLTSNNLLVNIAPNTPVCSTVGGGTFTLSAGPNPPQYPYLGNGGTTTFQWDYATNGVNNTRVTCTVSLQNGIASNTASDSAIVTTLKNNGQNRMDMANKGLVIRNPATTFATIIAGGAVTANRTLNTPVLTQTETMAVQPTISFSTPANKTGTNSLTGVMDGLAVAFTPKVTGRIQITISMMAASDTNGDGCQASIRYGTGGAPANGAAVTGTKLGTVHTSMSSTGNFRNTLVLSDIATGLTVGTAYWVDVGFVAITGGTCTLTNTDVSIIEI